MEKKILFPQIGGIMHGGDYNPEQWLSAGYQDLLGIRNSGWIVLTFWKKISA